MYTIGMRPGEVYSETRMKRGACPSPGTRGVDASGREFILLKVGATAHTNGHAVVWNTATFTTVLGTAAGAGQPNLGPVAIVHCSITASASHMVWAQIYGNCSTAIFSATGSALPGASVKFGADGSLTAASITTASHYISGLNVTATVSTADSPVGNVFLNYPRVVG